MTSALQTNSHTHKSKGVSPRLQARAETAKKGIVLPSALLSVQFDGLPGLTQEPLLFSMRQQNLESGMKSTRLHRLQCSLCRTLPPLRHIFRSFLFTFVFAFPVVEANHTQAQSTVVLRYISHGSKETSMIPPKYVDAISTSNDLLRSKHPALRFQPFRGQSVLTPM